MHSFCDHLIHYSISHTRIVDNPCAKTQQNIRSSWYIRISTPPTQSAWRVLITIAKRRSRAFIRAADDQNRFGRSWDTGPRSCYAYYAKIARYAYDTYHTRLGTSYASTILVALKWRPLWIESRIAFAKRHSMIVSTEASRENKNWGLHLIK
jgi:hypothetical protein